MTQIVFNENKQEYVQQILDTCPPRFAQLEDADAITQLELATFGDGPGHWRLQSHIKRVPMGTEVLYLDEQLVGCIRGNMYPSKIAEHRPYGEISSLAIATDYRGRGLGELLLGRMIYSMSEEDPTGICLYTRKSNIAMQGLSAKFGFTVEETIPDYYADPTEDAFFMVDRREPIPTHLPDK
ncbi:MAG TPA: GNAT family N-acetyltransferase [Candidatus Saccharimonadales bacterium]|nr:GNAT family N-acetyltransferase [Candidatus Saccharimonadales bacterium]